MYTAPSRFDRLKLFCTGRQLQWGAEVYNLATSIWDEPSPPNYQETKQLERFKPTTCHPSHRTALCQRYGLYFFQWFKGLLLSDILFSYRFQQGWWRTPGPCWNQWTLFSNKPWRSTSRASYVTMYNLRTMQLYTNLRHQSILAAFCFMRHLTRLSS